MKSFPCVGEYSSSLNDLSTIFSNGLYHIFDLAFNGCEVYKYSDVIKILEFDFYSIFKIDLKSCLSDLSESQVSIYLNYLKFLKSLKDSYNLAAAECHVEDFKNSLCSYHFDFYIRTIE